MKVTITERWELKTSDGRVRVTGTTGDKAVMVEVREESRGYGPNETAGQVASAHMSLEEWEEMVVAVAARVGRAKT